LPPGRRAEGHLFSSESSKTEYLPPVATRAPPRGKPFANMAVDEVYIPPQYILRIRRSGNFDAAWATAFLHSTANHSNTFPKPKLFLT